MELTEVKSLWEDIKKEEKTGGLLSAVDIQDSIAKSSRHTIYKFKKALAAKIILSGVVGVILMVEKSLFHPLDLPHEIAFFMPVLLGCCVLAAASLNARSYWHILEYEKKSYPLKLSLKRVVTIIEGVVKTGIYTDVVGITFLLLSLGFVQLYGGGSFVLDKRVIYMVFFLVSAPWLSYQIISRLQKLKHQSYIHDLQSCLSKLTDVEE